MVERSSGQAYKVSPVIKLIDNNLTISPSYQYYATTIIPASNKWDLIVSYNIPEIRGLNLLGVYGYLTNASVNANDLYQLQLMVSYLY
jgi:hypothetical protein